jgi:hypothetical protein
MDKIVPAFESTLFDPTLSDACIDMAELGIDSLLDDGYGYNNTITQSYIQTSSIGRLYCEISID